MEYEIVEVAEHGAAYAELLLLAEQLNQAKYIAAPKTHAAASVLLGAFSDGRCVGFLRCVIQVIGSDQGRPPITVAEQPLREGFVEAFGVASEQRRQGIGRRLQAHAMALCRARGCYQIRSRSPITSQENYALKLKMGYAIHPSSENDSYYFIKTLPQV